MLRWHDTLLQRTLEHQHRILEFLSRGLVYEGVPSVEFLPTLFHVDGLETMNGGH